MEDVYPRITRTDERELYLRTIGGSRIVYFPWDIDRTFWDVLCVDHGRLLRNAIRWATNEPPPVEVEGPGMLDVTIWRQRGSLTVHIVNLTNPDDDERTAARGHSRRSGCACGSACRREPRPGKVQLLTAKPARARIAPSDDGVLVVTVPIDRRARSDCSDL